MRPQHVMSVRNICDAYTARVYISPSTAKSVTFLFRKYIEPEIGDLSAEDLTSTHFDGLASKMANDGSSRQTTYRVLTRFAAAIAHAETQGVVRRGTATEVRSSVRRLFPYASIRRPDTPREYPTPPEFRKIVGSANEMWRAMILMLGFTGCPIHVLRELTWEHVSLDRQCIQYNLKTLRGLRSKRIAFLPPIAVQALRDWKRVQNASSDHLVFPNSSGGEISGRDLKAGFERVQLSAGILRDTAGNTLVACTKPIARYKIGSLRYFFMELQALTFSQANFSLPAREKAEFSINMSLGEYLDRIAVAERAVLSESELNEI